MDRLTACCYLLLPASKERLGLRYGLWACGLTLLLGGAPVKIALGPDDELPRYEVAADEHQMGGT